MKKGKVYFAISGILNIIFSLGIIAIIVLNFLLPEYVNIIINYLKSFVSIITDKFPVDFPVTPILLIIIILGIIALVNFIYGLVIIYKTRKEKKYYYKQNKSLIFFLISDFLVLSFFIAVNVYFFVKTKSYDILPICLVILPFISFLFKFIGLIRYAIGKRKLEKRNLEKMQKLPEFDSLEMDGDLITKLKKLNALKDSGDISEKEYMSAKNKLLKY